MYMFMVKSTIQPQAAQKIIDYPSSHLDEVVATGCFESWKCEYHIDSNQLIVRYNAHK